MTIDHLPPDSRWRIVRADGRMKTESGRFYRFARLASRLVGRPVTFSVALLVILVWLVLGPAFRFSDTWQITINTAAALITFLIVIPDPALAEPRHRRHPDQAERTDPRHPRRPQRHREPGRGGRNDHGGTATAVRAARGRSPRGLPQGQSPRWHAQCMNRNSRHDRRRKEAAC